MSYIRVIPRDLFNEGNLLKCYGQLALKIDILNVPDVRVEHFNFNDPFDVRQNPDDGSLTIDNVVLMVGDYGCALSRPLNSRYPWPLYLTTPTGDELAVFDDAGEFTPELLAFIGAK